MQIDWSKYLSISSIELDKYIQLHSISSDFKLNARFYSIKFKGNLLDVNPFAEHLSDLIHHFVYSAKEIEKWGPAKARGKANKYFGGGDPNSNGKYGELLLFILVEAILECPIVAFKIKALSNLSNQVNGGDGIFTGNYEIDKGNVQSVLLIGESKITEKLATGLDEAFKSIDRFHNPSHSSSFISTEMVVARQHLRLDLNTQEELDTLYDMLTFGTQEHNSNTWAHPILIVYNLDCINNMEQNCTNNLQIEAELLKYLSRRKGAITNLIKRKLKLYPEVKKVILDFFIIPVKEVGALRKSMYYHIHGHEYEK